VTENTLNYRVLSPREEDYLRLMALPISVEQVVRRVWRAAKEPPKPMTGWIPNIIGYSLIPAIIAMLVISLFWANVHFAKKIENFAVLIAWVATILTWLIVWVATYWPILGHQKEEYIFGFSSMKIWYEEKHSAKGFTLKKALLVALILTLAFTGHVITAFFFALTWIGNRIFVGDIYKKVQDVIDCEIASG
jgi:hypothetical protein